MRKSEVARKTRETDIFIALDLDGEGRSSIDTGIPFMNHMLELFARHGFFDLTVRAKGDIEVDYHHTMEDLGLVLGDVLAQALGDKAGIRRYGQLHPADGRDARARRAGSLRPPPAWSGTSISRPPMIRDLDTRLFCEFFQALVNRAGMNLHVRKMAGEEVHHVAEAVFKAFAKALDQAVTHDPRVKGVLSTKGSL